MANVDDIRKVAGLESFLCRPSYAQLTEAAQDCPVIIVNISHRRSDAIIVLYRGDPVLVPLQYATPDVIQSPADGLGPRPAGVSDQNVSLILREIWTIIVQPIVEKLHHFASKLGTRIWWICTGAASRLPIHASGPYRSQEPNLPELFCSSYTPTMGTLIRARRTRMVGPSHQ